MRPFLRDVVMPIVVGPGLIVWCSIALFCNASATWLVRLGGSAFMIIGCGACALLIGRSANLGLRFVLHAIGFGIALSVLIVALGWIAYRPGVGVSLLAVATVGTLVLLVAQGRLR